SCGATRRWRRAPRATRWRASSVAASGRPSVRAGARIEGRAPGKAPVLVSLVFLLLLPVPAPAGDLYGAASGPQRDVQALLRSPDPAKRRAAIDQIEQQETLGAAQGALLIQERLGDEDPTVRERAAQALGHRQVME